jgi:hypothetical protein
MITVSFDPNTVALGIIVGFVLGLAFGFGIRSI